MRDWLTEGILSSSALPEEAEGFVLGRGLPSWLAEDMRVGVWRSSLLSEDAPDADFRKKNGPRGQKRDGWLTIPFWSPRGQLLGVEYRFWHGEKKVWEHRLTEAAWNPIFMGLTPRTFEKIWRGGDVWLVEGVFDLAIDHAIPPKDVALACGTARVSRNQINFLQRFVSDQATVHVAFDEDETGRRQVEGWIDDETGKRVPGVVERLERVSLRTRDVRYHGSKDPGEIWEKGGKTALQRTFTTTM